MDFLQAIAEWVEDFDEFSATAEELIDANDDQVVVRVHRGAKRGPNRGRFLVRAHARGLQAQTPRHAHDQAERVEGRRDPGVVREQRAAA
jgi:hypothetical protein